MSLPSSSRTGSEEGSEDVEVTGGSRKKWTEKFVAGGIGAAGKTVEKVKQGDWSNTDSLLDDDAPF